MNVQLPGSVSGRRSGAARHTVEVSDREDASALHVSQNPAPILGPGPKCSADMELMAGNRQHHLTRRTVCCVKQAIIGIVRYVLD